MNEDERKRIDERIAEIRARSGHGQIVIEIHEDKIAQINTLTKEKPPFGVVYNITA